MPLNKTNGDMYDFVSHTWNAIKGKCSHDCSYCYMKRWGKQKPVHFDEKEYRTNLGSGNFIFIGSSCDMWAADIPSMWIDMVLNKASRYQNKYLFQTKNPENFIHHRSRLSVERDILCTTIETNWYFPGVSENAPRFSDRAEAMGIMSARGYKTMVTIEPIMDFDPHSLIRLIKQCNPFQVNIGADSGNHGLPEPPKGKVIEFISELRKFTTVVEKNNIRRLVA